LRVKGAECPRRPADKQQECDDDKPACQDVAGERPEAGAFRRGAGEGQREHDQRQNQVGTFERLAECKSGRQQRADRHKRIERRLHQRGRREPVVQEWALGLVRGEQSGTEAVTVMSEEAVCPGYLFIAIRRRETPFGTFATTCGAQ